MKAIVVVPRISAESSGPSYSVPGLCRGLKAARCDVSLHFAGDRPNHKFDYAATAYPIVNWPNKRLCRAPSMLSALQEECQNADIIHNNSLWLYPNVYPAWAKRGTLCKLVTAPRGTLAKWSLEHHSLQKRLFGWYAQRKAMAATDMWHATCEKEYQEIREAGYLQPVAIVPVGMDLPEIAVYKEEKRRRNASERKERRKVVFFGRLHKVKGVDNLVMAWGRIAERHRDWELVIAGPDGGIKGELQGLIDNGRIPRASFAGEINGTEKYAFLSSADLFVLPSHTENFAVTVAESLACGTPVIVSKGAPWSGVTVNGCGMWIDANIETLAAALEEMMGLDAAKRDEMGLRGREWMRRDFGWDSVGMNMKLSYEWLLNGGEPPEWVRIG